MEFCHHLNGICKIWFQGMKDRENLTGSPELGLKNAITHRDNVDDYGHLIYEALKKVQSYYHHQINIHDYFPDYYQTLIIPSRYGHQCKFHNFFLISLQSFWPIRFYKMVA